MGALPTSPRSPNTADLTLTQLIDVVLKSGGPKLTCVKKIKAQLTTPYDPAADMYKVLREGIADAHRLNQPKMSLTALASSVGGRRQTLYLPLAASYIKWWGQKAIGWFAPPRSVWTPAGGSFGVIVNPELGLVIDGRRYVVKLYFKAGKLTKSRIEIASQLMHDEFSAAQPNASFAVLDVRNGKLHTVAPPTGTRAMLVAEMAYVAALWPTI